MTTAKAAWLATLAMCAGCGGCGTANTPVASSDDTNVADSTFVDDASSASPDASDASSTTDGAAMDTTSGADATSTGAPHLGAHALVHYRYMTSSPTTLSTPPLATQASGSTILVSVGRGKKANFAIPTDNDGNVYSLLGMHPYTRWPDSGVATYGFPHAKGGAGQVITTTTTPDDEITMAAVEVIGGSKIVDAQWTEVLVGSPLKSKSVTTTGAATLVAFWWGDGYWETTPQTATAGSGFTVVDSVLETGSFVQSAVAVKSVDTAGTYDVTWTATPAQGAQLWLVAVQ